MTDMKVYYEDGEVEVYKEVAFEAYDLEGIIVPILAALIFDGPGKQICILLDKVKKIEFVEVDEE